MAIETLTKPETSKDSTLPFDAFPVSTTPQDAKWTQSIDDLLKLRTMEDNWDGFDALAPKTETVDLGLKVIQALRHKPNASAPDRVMPSVAGSVLIEWQSPDGTFSELEILDGRNLEFFAFKNRQVIRNFVVQYEE